MKAITALLGEQCKPSRKILTGAPSIRASACLGIPRREWAIGQQCFVVAGSREGDVETASSFSEMIGKKAGDPRNVFRGTDWQKMSSAECIEMVINILYPC